MTMFASSPALSPAQLAAVAKLAYALEATGSLAVLCGAAGVGKTLVLDAVARHVASGGGAGAAGRRPERGRTASRLPLAGVRDLVASATPLPDVVLVDDAHLAEDGEIGRLIDACRSGRPDMGIVLAGQGRLLTLLARDARLERSVRLRVTVPPFSKAETRLLVAALTGAGALPRDDQEVATTIHEIAGGIPAEIVRLAELAAVVANGTSGQPLTVADVETIHRRLGINAA